MANIISGRWMMGRHIMAGRGLGGVAVINYPVLESGYAVKVYTAAGEKIAEVGSDIQDNPVESVEFALMETGCAEFSLVLSKPIAGVTLNYNHRIDIHLFGDPKPWYSGYIITKPMPGSTERKLTYEGFGFFNQLGNVIVNQVYENSEISAVVNHIMTNIVEPKTDIVYRPTKVIATGYTATKIRFDYSTCAEAISQLAEFATNYLYGVDEYREFFFKPLEWTINEDSRFWAGYHVEEFTPEEDVETVKNFLYIRAGKLDDQGSNILYTCQDTVSQGAYGLREDVLKIPSALTAVDAQRWGDYQLSLLKNPSLSGDVDYIKLNKKRITAQGLARIYANDGSVYYDMRIKKVNYRVDKEGIVCGMSLGELPANMDSFIVDLLRYARNQEIIQQLINMQLKGISV